MPTLTTANSAFALQIAGLYPIAQNIQGYATDDAFSVDDIEPAEVMMGVDGRLSGGYVPTPKKLGIMMQADSPSLAIFDNWMAAQDASKEIYIANAVIILQGTGDKYAMTRGILTSASPMSASKKVLQPRHFVITFEQISKAPI